jgi:hypothetical protein
VLAGWLIVGVSASALAQPAQQVDLDELPEAFRAVEEDYARQRGPVVDGTEHVNGVRLVQDHLMPYANDASPFYTGLDAQFMARVREEAARGGPLGPADLYRISLEVNGQQMDELGFGPTGDRFRSLVTVHDALKATGRALQVGRATEQDMRALVGDAFFDDYVRDLGRPYSVNDANRLGEAFLAETLQPIGNGQDYTGRYYHMFGSAVASLNGRLTGLTPGIHARMVNIQSVKRDLQEQTRDYYGDGLLGDFLVAAAGPVGAVASGFGSFGEYTIVHHHKAAADEAGVDIGAALRKAPDLPSLVSDDSGLAGGPAVSDYARGVTDPTFVPDDGDVSVPPTPPSSTSDDPTANDPTGSDGSSAAQPTP